MLVGCIPIYWTSETDYLSKVFDMNGIVTFSDTQQLYSAIQQGFFSEELYNKNIEAVKHNYEIAKQYASFGNVMWKYGIKDLLESRGLI